MDLALQSSSFRCSTANMGAPENDGFLEYRGVFPGSKRLFGVPSREFTYPTLGKGKSSSNMSWDMLVPRRV